MTRTINFLFSKAYFLFRDYLGVKENTHFSASFILGLLIVPYAILIVDIITLLLRNDTFNVIVLYVLLGNILIFSIAYFFKKNERYIKVIEEFQNLSKPQRRQLNYISIVYLAVTLVVVFLLIKIH